MFNNDFCIKYKQEFKKKIFIWNWASCPQIFYWRAIQRIWHWCSFCKPAILLIKCISNSSVVSSKILKNWKYQTLLTCLSRITFHPPSSIQFSLPPDCHLMICNDCGLAAGSCRVQNILSLSNNGNIIQQWPSAVTCAVLRWDCLDSLKLEVEQCPRYLPPPPHLFVIDKSCWTVWTFNCVLGWCWSCYNSCTHIYRDN